MKQIALFNVLLALALGLVPKATALRLEFSNLEGSRVRFDGTNPTDGVGTFAFYPAFPGNQFMITESDGAGSARDRQGRIDGTFCIGVITMDGARQMAPVLGAGTLRIYDGAGHELTGTLGWNQITVTTLSSRVSEGSLNSESILNLTGIAYDGRVADLVTLAAAGTGQVTLGLQLFDADPSLVGLTRDGYVKVTSFSGRIVAVPEPAAWALWGLGLAGLVCGALRKVSGHHARAFL